MCGADHHVCTLRRLPGRRPERDPPGRALSPAPPLASTASSTTTRSRPANPGRPQPAFDVTGSLQVCPQNAGFLGVPTDEPGPRLHRRHVRGAGAQPADGQRHRGAGHHQQGRRQPPRGELGPGGQPGRQRLPLPGRARPAGVAGAGPGVATYDSDPLPADFTMLGSTRVMVPHTGAGAGLQLNARLYDLYPDGTQVLVDRGVKRLADANGTTTLDLHGAGWRFAKGHRIRIELAQDDDPYIKSSVQASALNLSGVTLSVPIREPSTALGWRRRGGASARAAPGQRPGNPSAVPAPRPACADRRHPGPLRSRGARHALAPWTPADLAPARIAGALPRPARAHLPLPRPCDRPCRGGGAVGIGPHDRAAGRRPQAAALPRPLAARPLAAGVTAGSSRAPAGGAPASRYGCGARGSTWSGGAQGGAARHWCASTDAGERPFPSTGAHAQPEGGGPPARQAPRRQPRSDHGAGPQRREERPRTAGRG